LQTSRSSNIRIRRVRRRFVNWIGSPNLPISPTTLILILLAFRPLCWIFLQLCELGSVLSLQSALPSAPCAHPHPSAPFDSGSIFGARLVPLLVVPPSSQLASPAGGDPAPPHTHLSIWLAAAVGFFFAIQTRWYSLSDCASVSRNSSSPPPSQRRLEWLQAHATPAGSGRMGRYPGTHCALYLPQTRLAMRCRRPPRC
jgi:hypothetical protein